MSSLLSPPVAPPQARTESPAAWPATRPVGRRLATSGADDRVALSWAVAGLLGGLGVMAAWLLWRHAAGGLAVEQALLLALHRAGRGWPAFWSTMSVLGLGLTVVVGLLALAWPRPGVPARLLAAWLWCLPIGGVVTHGLKRALLAARPPAVIDPEQLQVIGAPLLTHSMPSGHALTGFALAMLLQLDARQPRAVRVAAWLFALGVALSRVIVGAHWPADVVVGAVLGCGVGALGWWLAGRGRLADWLAAPRGIAGRVVVLLAASGVLGMLSTGYPLAAPMQQVLAVLCGGLALLMTAELVRTRFRTLPLTGLRGGPREIDPLPPVEAPDGRAPAAGAP